MTKKPSKSSASEAKPPLKTDVMIVGGGLAGLSLAVALASGGLEVAIIDTEDPKTASEMAFDGRSFAVAHGPARMLQALGVWDLMPVEPEPIQDILISDGRVSNRFRDGGAAPFVLHFDQQELGDADEAGSALGYMVEARHARQALYAAMNKFEKIHLFAPAKATRVDFCDTHVSATLEDGTELEAALCVGADGRGSPLRAQAGIKKVGWSYNQHGIVTTVAHEKPHLGVAQEYFLPSGPFAILPLTDNRSSLVWTEKSDLTPYFMGLDDDAFMEEVRRRFGDYLGEVTLAGPRFAYPLSIQIARDFIAPRLALVGDAVHGIHPISGQGWNLGLKGVAALSEVVTNAHRLGLDVGSHTILEEYERWRRFDSVTLGVITDGLNRLFANDFGPLKLARDIGMQAVGYLNPLKKVFIRHAAGVMGDLPKLLKGEPL